MGIETLIIGTLTAIGVGAGAAAVATTVITTIGSIALTFAAGRLIGLIFGGPTFDPTDSQRVDLSPAAPRNFVYGVAPVGGRVVYSLLEDNEYQWIVYALTGHEIEDIQAVWIEEQRYTFNQNGDFFELDTNEDIGDVFRLYKLAGTSDQQATPDLINADDSEWTADHRGRGIGMAVIRWRVDREILPRGIPTTSTFFEVVGKKLYDPRLDDSMGGTGLQRINDPDTWTHSSNPALAWFDHQRGHAENGVVVFGHGLYPGELYTQTNPDTPRAVMEMLPSVIEAANVCDEQIGVVAGGTINRYQIDASFRTNLDWADVDETMIQSCAGFAVDGPRGNRIVAGSARAPIATIEGLRKISHPSISLLAETDIAFNVARAQYLEPDAIWSEFDAPAYQDTARITNTGRIIPRQLSLPHQTDHRRAQRLSKILLERSQIGKTIGWQEHLDAMDIPVLSRVIINDPDLNINGEIFRIIGRQFAITPDSQQTLTVAFTATAEPDLIYDWDFATEELDITTIQPIQTVGRLSTPNLSASDDGTNIAINYEATDNRSQSITFRRNLVGITSFLTVGVAEIDTALNTISTANPHPRGTPVFLTRNVDGLLTGTQYYLRSSDDGLTTTIHTTLAGSVSGTNTVNVADITGTTGFTLLIGSVGALGLQIFSNQTTPSGQVLIQNRINSVDYTIEAISTSNNITSSTPASITVST